MIQISVARRTANGTTALRAVRYDIVADSLPSGSFLHMRVTSGIWSTKYDKPCIFNANTIAKINSAPGRHDAVTRGQAIWPKHPEAAMLHHKFLGDDYLPHRSHVLNKGLDCMIWS
jgi:hypothetical protein